MLINKGTDINASWTNSIATSAGNGTWKTISAANLTVSPQVTRDRNQTSKHKITLLDGTDELEWFFLSDVTNQATWTDDTAGLVKAVLDITTWIGTVTDSVSEILAELIAIKNKVATESTLASLNSKDFATQATLALLEGKDFATQTTLALLEGKDFATDTKLELVRALLASIDGKDFATQTTLALLEGKDFATQTTLELVRLLLASVDGKDFATQTTLAALEGKDFATQTTLELVRLLLVGLEGKDFATQTTLALLEGKDFATQTTLAEIKAKTELLTFEDEELKTTGGAATDNSLLATQEKQAESNQLLHSLTEMTSEMKMMNKQLSMITGVELEIDNN
jgi:hypothetical protein